MKFGFVFVGMAYDRDKFIVSSSLPDIDNDCDLETFSIINIDFKHKLSIATDSLTKLYRRLKVIYNLGNWREKGYPLVLEYCPKRYLREIGDKLEIYPQMRENDKDYFLLENGLFNRKIYGVPSYSALEKFWNSREFLREIEFNLDKDYMEVLDFLETIQDSWEKEEKYWIEKIGSA